MARIGPLSVHGVATVTAEAVTRNTSGTSHLYGCVSLEFHERPAERLVELDVFTDDPGYAHGLASAIYEFNARYEADQAAARQAAE